MAKEKTQTPITIPGDMVQKSLSRLLAGGEIDDAQRAEIWWYYSHAKDNHWSLDQAGSTIRRDSSTAHRLFTGNYAAKYDNLVEGIISYHRIADKRGRRKVLGFVETTTYQKIDKICTHALVTQSPAFIYGQSQIGKTASLEEWASRNNHGTTRMIRCPAAPTLCSIMDELATALYVGTHSGKQTERRRRIISAIDSNMILIVDELHQAMISTSPSTTVRIIEFLREIYDRCQCGMVFCGTEVLQSEIEQGKLQLILDQFRRRGIVKLVLPAKPPAADINKIAQAFELAPPDGLAADIIDAMVTSSGIGQYIKFLQSASNLANRQNKPLSWDHFVIAYDAIQQLSTKSKKG